jgi:PAS domain S-box-containing protein
MPAVLAELAKHPGSTVYRDVPVGDSVLRISIFHPRGLDVLRVYSIDITGLVRAEEELLKAKEDWERTFDSVPDLIAILDDKHRILRANRAMLERLGTASGKCIGMQCYQCVHGTDAPPASCPHEQTLLDGKEHTAEIHEDMLGGDFFVSTTPLRDGSGKMVGSVHVARDITERKRREKELAEIKEALARKDRMESLGRLAGGTGQELSVPLTAIKNAVYYLQMVTAQAGPEVRESLEILRREVGASETILRNLLDIAHARPPDMKQVDLNELLGRTLSRSQVPGGVEIVRQGGEGLPRITADPDQLEVVFRNLVQNAVEAMPGGGRLEVSSRRAGDTSVSVTVKDAGRGIPEKNLGRLFDPFFTTKPRGIGLGLPVARTLVENHGGTISVESQSGKGSTFTVTLPVNRMGGENQ